MKNNNLISLEDDDPLEMYMKPYKDDFSQLISFVNGNEEPDSFVKSKTVVNSKENSFINDNLSKYSIKEKFQKIFVSVQALNISFKNTNSLNDINSMLEELDKKTLSFTNNLFDVIIELICKIKEEFIKKEELVAKINNITKNTDDYERKILKLRKELASKEREISLIINKANLEKEKIQNNKKSTNSEISELKSENKKLTNLISLYKNEIRKKEIDYSKIQEKYKIILSKSNNTIIFKNTFDIISRLKMNEIPNKNLALLQETTTKFNKMTFSIITNENNSLITLLKLINKFTASIYNTLNEGKKDKDTEYIEINNDIINNNNLIDDNSVRELTENFINNYDYLNQKVENIMSINRKNKSLKRTESGFEFKVNPMNLGHQFDMNSSSKTIPHNRSKWFEHSYNKKAHYQFDKNNVIKCDNSNDEL